MASDRSITAGRRSTALEFVKLATTDAKPTKTKSFPVTRMTFLLEPRSTEAPVRNLAIFESGIFANVFVPNETTPAPVPAKISTCPLALKLAVHLPKHFKEPTS